MLEVSWQSTFMDEVSQMFIHYITKKFFISTMNHKGLCHIEFQCGTVPLPPLLQNLWY